MVGKSPIQTNGDLFRSSLTQIINLNHPLVLLSKKIDWNKIEQELSSCYSQHGRKSMPIRFMVGCLILKRLENLGDETLAKVWLRDPYIQYFTGENYFQHKFPCDPSDFVHFRNRIGEKGIELIFSHSVELHGKNAFSKIVLQDTTVQENDTSFPTDAKLAKKIIDHCNKITKRERVSQRQSYTRTSKQLLRNCYNSVHPKRAKKAKSSQSKLKTIAGRQVRELRRNLSAKALIKYEEKLQIFEKVLRQTRLSKDKIYSLHKAFTSCIAKGKAHKKYEFGNKIGLMVDSKTLIIHAIESFKGNPHDSKTIEPLLNQAKHNFGFLPKEVVYDRGGRGKKQIQGVTIITPSKPKKEDSRYERQKKREKFRRRAAIEPVIGHLKTDMRMGQNYLHGDNSPKMNALLAATGWNLKKLMETLEREFLFLFFHIRKWCQITNNFATQNCFLA